MGHARDLNSAGRGSYDLQNYDPAEIPNRRRFPSDHLGESDLLLHRSTNYVMLTVRQVGATAYSAMMQLAYHNGFGRHSRKRTHPKQASTSDIC